MGGEAVAAAAFGTGGEAFCVEVQRVAVFAHPAGLPRRIAHHERIVGNVVRNNGPRANHGVFSDNVSADNGGVGAYGGTLFNAGGLVLVFADYGAAGVDNVGEDAGGAEKYIVLANNARINRYIVLHLDIIAQHHAGAHHHVLPDIAVAADAAPAHKVAEVPYLASLANLHPLVHHRRCMHKV